jgi:tetratricopeptide (TPR) repeat protein
VFDAVQLAVHAAISVPSDSASAATQYTLSRLSADALSLLALFAAVAPDQPISALLRYLQQWWHRSFPPFQDLLHNQTRSEVALRGLQRAQVLRRVNDDLVLPATIAVSVRQSLEPELSQDAVSNSLLIIGSFLGYGANPETWSDWQVLAPHVEALGQADVDHDLRISVRLMNELSAYRRATHQPAAALTAAKKALAIAHRVSGGYIDIAPLLANEAMALDDLDQTQDALQLLIKAVRILERDRGNGAQLAGVLNMRGGVRQRLGQHKKAIEDRERGIQMLEGQDGMSRDLAELYNDVAISYEEYKKFDQALAAYRRVQELVGENYGGAEASLNEGLLLQALGQHDDAAVVLHRAEDALSRRYPRCSWRVWRVNQALGDAYAALGEHNRAERYWQTANDINREAISQDLRGPGVP